MDLSKWTDLREWRKKIGMSQQKLAKTAKISLGTIRQIEAGSTKPHRKTLKKLTSTVKKMASELPKFEKPDTAKVEAPEKKAAKKQLKKAAAAEVTAKPPTKSEPILLTNLDLELINRILRMTGQEKLSLLQKLMQ